MSLVFVGLCFRSSTEARVLRFAGRSQLLGVRAGAKPAHALAGPRGQEVWCPATLEYGTFGRIEIPRLGISALIAEGAGSAQLDRCVGHITTSVFPGQSGNCALAGHRDSFLRGLEDVRENDVIQIDTLQGTYTYLVQWRAAVGPRRVDVLAETNEPSLTLVTCYPFRATGLAPDRFVVRARLVAR